MGGAQPSSARDFAFFIFTLEGVSEAEIGLDKVVVSQIWEVITKFAENRNIGSKAVFEPAADMPEHLANQYRTSAARAPNAKGLSFCQSNAESVLRNPLPKYSDNHYINLG